MRDLYYLSYESFMLFLNKIVERYDDNRKVIKHIIIDLLTNKRSLFNTDLNEFVEKSGANLEVCKRALMYMLVSKSYVMNYYDSFHGINPSYSEPFIATLESLTNEDIIDMFYKPTEMTDDIIEDFLAYIQRPYTFKFKAKELIFKNGKLQTLLELNPLEFLDIWDYIPDEELTKPEKYIQRFFDLYDKSISECAEDINGEKENYESMDDYEHSVLIQNIYESFENDIAQITMFINYIQSNVYEFLIIEKNNGYKDYKDCFDLIEFLEDHDIYELRDEFLNNREFAFRIIDIFTEQNSTLDEDDLLEKREEFKQHGDIKLLRKLNPYYDAEEIVYQKIKETSEIN